MQSSNVHSDMVTERIKRQLLWCFDLTGSADAEMFLSVLEHEQCVLRPRVLLALMRELTRRVQRPAAGPIETLQGATRQRYNTFTLSKG